MKLFDIVPSELFSILASPNRSIYADALLVLYDAFQDRLKISEDMYFSMLRNRLENDLARLDFEDEGIYEEEVQDISGRARFLIRRLREKGWIDRERKEDFSDFYIIIPDYSIKLLELFSSLLRPKSESGFSYVYETYSALKLANEGEDIYEKLMALYGAYDKTQALIKMLKTVYHNINRYFQQQIDMKDVNDVLAAHFDDFLQRIMEAHIRPLKIKDSVPKYRIPIKQILDSWLEHEEIIAGMARQALQEKRFASWEECRHDIIDKIFFIKESYECFEQEYLNEIDAKVRRYTRSTTQKIETLTNNDRTVRGNLVYLLNKLTENPQDDELPERIQAVFHLYEQTFLSEKSLYVRRNAEKRSRQDPVLLNVDTVDLSDKITEYDYLVNSPYSKPNLLAFMNSFMQDREVAFSRDLNVNDDISYIISLLLVSSLDEGSHAYNTAVLPGEVEAGIYTIPQIRFERKKEK
ncbi:MAG: DUF5716 family protein [Firmicutes bacterium]|nr:DUF5716 family protein [Bacillota bacterium]